MTDFYWLNQGWPILLKDLELDPNEVLEQAHLPSNLFAKGEIGLTSKEYFGFWNALQAVSRDPLLPVRLVECLTSEFFDPPIFASLCSPNLNIALKRLSQYKALISPILLDVTNENETTKLCIIYHEEASCIPAQLTMAELAFFAKLARMGTREHIQPIQVEAPLEESYLDQFTFFFGSKPIRGNSTNIIFSKEDSEMPFVTENQGMWNFFEPSLRSLLTDLKANDTISNKVRAALHQMLPSGQTSIEEVAERLLMSKRTLQRRLSDNHTNFREILDEVREKTARHYITNTVMPYTQVAFLLGYDDPNSFFRAFSRWTGSTPDSIRALGAK